MGHEVTVEFARGAAAFIHRPEHQALTAATNTGSENALDVGGVLFELGFNVGAGVALDSQSFEKRLFGPEKAHCEQDQLSRAPLLGAGHFFGNKLALFITLPLDLHGDRKSTRLNSSHGYISYAVFCLKKK